MCLHAGTLKYVHRSFPVSSSGRIGTLGAVYMGVGGGGGEILVLGRPEKAETLFVCFTCRNFGRSGYQVEKEKKNNYRP